MCVCVWYVREDYDSLLPLPQTMFNVTTSKMHSPYGYSIVNELSWWFWQSFVEFAEINAFPILHRISLTANIRMKWRRISVKCAYMNLSSYHIVEWHWKSSHMNVCFCIYLPRTNVNESSLADLYWLCFFVFFIFSYHRKLFVIIIIYLVRYLFITRY